VFSECIEPSPVEPFLIQLKYGFMNYSSVTATVAGKVNPFYGQCVPLLPEKLLEKGRIGETQREE